MKLYTERARKFTSDRTGLLPWLEPFMPLTPPYDPRRYPRATRYIAGGRLRSLKRVLLSNRFQRLAGKSITRRPMGWTDDWPHYAEHAVYRNGHQECNRNRLVMAVTAMAKAQRAYRKNFAAEPDR
jgi:hypothetical protein